MRTAIHTIILMAAFALTVNATASDNQLFGPMSPDLSVTPNPYTFEETYVGQTSSAMFLFANNGTDPVVVTDITFTDPAFSIDYTSFTINPGESGELPIYFSPSSPGYYEGTMQIFSNNPVNPYEVQLSGTGTIELNQGWQWIQTPYDYILTDMAFPEGQNQIGYCVGQKNTYNGEGLVIKTTDGGDTWEQIVPDGIPWLNGLSFPEINTGYACGLDGYLIKTTNGGSTWDTLFVQSGISRIMDVEFRDADHGIVATLSQGVFVTEDGGQTWTAATGYTTPFNMVAYASDTILIGVGSMDIINRSLDGGYTWAQMYSTSNSDFTLTSVYFLDENNGLASGDFGHVYKTTNAGLAWTLYNAGGDAVLHAPFMWDQDTAWVVGIFDGIFKSLDGGMNWSPAFNYVAGRTFYRILFTDNYTGFVCGSHGVVLRKAGLDGPILEVEPTTVEFEDTYIGETSSVNILFANTGNEALNVSDITFTNPAFSIDYTTFTINPGESGELPVHFTPPSEGTFEGTMQIISNNIFGDTVEIQLSGNGIVELIDGWQWIETGFDYILTDMEFPEGQNQIGYCVGQANTYNGEGLVIKTTDGGDTWTQMTPAGTLWLTAISFPNLNTGYVGGWGGNLLKTTDGGTTWETIEVQSSIYKISDVEFRDENHGIVSTIGSGVYVTEDGGQTWSSAYGLDTPPKMVAYADENKVFGVGNEDRIYRSTDGGYNWELLYTTGNPENILLGVYFLNSDYGMAAGDYGHVYKTTDGGDNWIQMIPGYDDLFHTPFIWDEDTTWVSGTPELVYKTTDGGNTWLPAYAGNYQRAFYRITFTDNYTGYICGSHGVVMRKAGYDGPILEVTPQSLQFEDTYVGETSSVMVTFSNPGNETLTVNDITFTNPAFSIGYTSFTIEPGESGELPVNFTPPAEGTFEGTMQIHSDNIFGDPVEIELSGNGVIELIDGWQWIETGFDYILTDIEFPEGQNQIGYCVGQANTYNGEGLVIKTTDGGDTWEQITPEGIPWLNGCSFPEINTGYAAGLDGYLIKTTDGGATWDTLFVQYGIFKILDVEFRDVMNGIVTTLYSGIFVTDDGGESWTLASGNTVQPKMVAYADDNTVFGVGNEDRINRSTDGGYTWSEVYMTGNPDNILLGVYFLNADYGMAAGDYGHIYKTTDGGDTWTQMIPGADDLLHTPFIWDEDTTWVSGTPELVYKTTDGGNTWNSAYAGNFQRAFYRITFTDNYTGFICGSHGVVMRKAGLSGPILNVPATSIEFEETYVGDTASVTISLANTGDATLNITGITFTNPVFTTDITSLAIEPGETQELTVSFIPEVPGPTEGTMQIISNSIFGDPYEIQLSGTGATGLIDGWEWINTGFDSYNLTDIQFPLGQKEIGFCIGQEDSYTGNGIILKTTDGGDTWTKVSPDNTPVLMGMSFTGTSTGYAGGMNGYLIKTVNSGYSWETIVIQAGITAITDIEFRNISHGVVATAESGIFVTEDGGETWTPATGMSEDMSPMMVAYADENTLFAVGDMDIIDRSTDGGYTWEQVHSTTSSDYLLTGVHFLNSDYGLASGDYGHIYKTLDGGDTWSLYETSEEDLIWDPYIWNQDTAWVAGAAELVMKTTNGGTSWNQAFTPVSDADFYRIIFTNNYTGFMCGSNGVILRKAGFPEEPVINVSPEALVFDTTMVYTTSAKTVTVTNTGFAVLDVLSVVSSNAAFSPDLTSFGLFPGESAEIEVTFAPTEVMLYEGNLIIESNDPNNGYLEIPLSGFGDINTGIAGQTMENAIRIYPVPAKEHIFIENAAEKEVFIYSLSGNLQYHTKCEFDTQKIDVSTFEPGIYMVKIVGNNSAVVRKISVTR